MKAKHNIFIIRACVAISFVFISVHFGHCQLLKNGDFETGVNDMLDFWSTDEWKHSGTVFKWEQGTGINGSRCISIENVEPNDGRWFQKVTLKPSTTYEFSGFVKGQNIQNHQSGDIYTNLSILENLANAQVKKSNFDWTKVVCRFTTHEEGDYTLCARNGFFWNVTTGKCWFDNLVMTEIGKPDLDTIKHDKIEFYIQVSDLTNISEENMERWLNHLDSAILKYEELIGAKPYTGYPLRVLSVDYYPGGWAVAGDPIKWYQIYIGQELKLINDHDDWSFGILHEIGHNFDYPYWNFHGEHFANFKMFYVIQDLNGGFWRDGEHILGHDYKDYYKDVYEMVKDHYQHTGEIMHLYGDALTYKFIDIADSIGWGPFKRTFRAYLTNPSIAQPGNVKKYFHFLDMLSKHSGKDVRRYLTWDDRNEFVLYLGSMKHPSPPSNLSIKNRDCSKLVLEWMDHSDNESGFILERRTGGTWYSDGITIKADCTSFCDSTLHSDSTYYYRIRSYNAYGPSDFSLELKIDTFPPPETPWFSHYQLSFKTGDTLHIEWTADTLNNDSVIWSFMMDKPDLTGDTICFIKTSLDFSRQLKAGFEVNNMMDSTRCFMALNLDLDPGNWNVEVDSIFMNKPLSPAFFQWIPMYDLPVPTWKTKIINMVEVNRQGYDIEVIFNEYFYGYFNIKVRGTDECGNLGPEEVVHIDVIPELSPPKLSHEYIEICEGEGLPEIFAIGENIRWYSDPNSPLYDFRDGQIYDVVTVGRHTWMNENLNTYTPSGSFYHKQDSLTYHPYGRNYSWELAENVCPQGWRIADRYKWWDLLDNIGFDPNTYNYHFIPPDHGSVLQSFYYWVPYYGFGAAPEGYVFIKVNEDNIIQESFFSKPDAVDVSQIPGFYIRCTKDKYRSVYEGNKLPIKRLEGGTYIFYVTQCMWGHEGPKDTLIIEVNPVPAPPFSMDYKICKNGPIPELVASGEGIRWYGNPEKTVELADGNTFVPSLVNTDTVQYFVTQSLLGCESLFDTVTLIQYPFPYFNLGDDTIIDINQHIVLGVENSQNTYHWSNGSISSTIEIHGEDIGLGQHLYWLNVYNEYGCHYEDSIYISVIRGTRSKNAGIDMLNVYPNPADDHVNIGFNAGNASTATIKLLDFTGKEVYKKVVNWSKINGPKEIDVSLLPNGLYTLVFEYSNARILKKLIIY